MLFSASPFLFPVRTLLFFVAAALLATNGFGQYTRQSYSSGNDSPGAQPRGAGTWNAVSIHLTQTLVREAQVSYERFVTRRLSLEGSAGVRIPNLQDNEVYGGMFSLDSDINYKAYPFIRSYYGALGIKWNFIPPSQQPSIPVYLTATPFYRYNYFHRMRFGLPASSSMSTYASEQSRTQHVPGLKLLLGVRLPVWRVNSTHALLVDVFAGAGIRRIMTTATTYGGVGGTTDTSLIKLYPEPITEKRSVSFSTIQCGAKLSFAWTGQGED